MDNSMINLFLEGDASNCLNDDYSYWELIEKSAGWQISLTSAVSHFESASPNQAHYWSGDREKLIQFAIDTTNYSNIRKYLANETLSVRKELLVIAEKINLFGESVVRVIDSSSAITTTQNLTQEQIDEFDNSLLSIEDAASVQTLSSHLEALREVTASSLDDVSEFQSKITELKFLLVNKVRPTVDGALAISFPSLRSMYDYMPTPIQAEKEYFQALKSLAKIDRTEIHSPLNYAYLLYAFAELSESLSRVQPALSKFEALWIETRSFIKNSHDNANTIQNVKMLKVFKVRMKNIMKDWDNVKARLGAQPVAIQ